jgi:hypothetical protein
MHSCRPAGRTCAPARGMPGAGRGEGRWRGLLAGPQRRRGSWRLACTAVGAMLGRHGQGQHGGCRTPHQVPSAWGQQQGAPAAWMVSQHQHLIDPECPHRPSGRSLQALSALAAATEKKLPWSGYKQTLGTSKDYLLALYLSQAVAVLCEKVGKGGGVGRRRCRGQTAHLTCAFVLSPADWSAGRRGRGGGGHGGVPAGLADAAEVCRLLRRAGGPDGPALQRGQQLPPGGASR